MSLDRNVELLGDVPLFHGLSQEQLTSIVNIGEKQFFETGETIVKRQKKGETAYLVLSGRAVTRPTKVSRLEPEPVEAGVLIGEMAMLTETVYSVDVVVEERVRALAIGRELLFALMEQDPSIAHHLAEKITERLIYFAHDLREADARFAMLEASLDESLASVQQA